MLLCEDFIKFDDCLNHAIRNSVETIQSDISVHAAKVLFWNSLVCKMITKC